MDEFLILNNKLNDLKNKKKKLEEYQLLLKEYESQLLEIDMEYSGKNIETEEYLKILKGKGFFDEYFR